MMFFEQYPEFVDSDVRKTRGTTTISSESLTKRCEVLLPKWFVEGKTVLDLGHCMGAFGHWVLSNGAKHYTGVDIQKSFCEKSYSLLGNYWKEDHYTIVESDVLKFLETTDQKYDIIIAAGVIHGYMDVVSLLKLITNASNEYVVIESQKVDESDSPSIKFKLHNMVSTSSGLPYAGWTPLIGYDALRAVMNEYGYELYGDRLYPEAIIDGHDSFNDKLETTKDSIYGIPERYMVRYKKSSTRKMSLQYNIQNDKKRFAKPNVRINDNAKIIKADRWKFDDTVAKRFQQEAETNIPDYERVIDMCLDIAKRKFNTESTIVDVGSALGHTIEKFNNAGYKYVYGVESSQAMFDNSKQQAYIKVSETFPTEWHADFVMANWTLHFINERKTYIQDIYNSLNDSGVLIVSDKTPQDPMVKEMYYDFKRANGVTDEYIYEKEEKLKGYMNLLPIEWYTDTLKEVGFKNIQIINAKFGFITFYAEK